MLKFFRRKKKPAGIPDAVFDEVDSVLPSFLKHYTRPEIRYSLTADLKGNSLTIYENRPGFLSKKVERSACARADYDHSTGLWSLFYPDRNSEWQLYSDLEPTSDFAALLETIEEDPVFFG